MFTRRSPLLIALCALVGLVLSPACSSEKEESCPPGETLRNGRCVPLQDGRPPRDTRGDDDSAVDPDGTDPTDPDGTDPVDPGSCAAGATRCAAARILETCAADGLSWERSDCESNQRCSTRTGEARCQIGGVIDCEPGVFLGCDGIAAQRICGPLGYDDNVVEPCPEATPSCFAFAGGCTTAVCEPGATFCDGDQIRSCNGDGSGSDLVEVCAGGCSEGQCVDPCLADFGKDSYVGCDFWAVWLDQFVGLRGAAAMAVTISNASSNQIEIAIYDPADNLVHEQQLGPNALAVVPVPLPSNLGRNTRVSSNTSWRITSTGPVTVHQFNPPNNQGQYSNDASLLLPTNAWGTEYMAIGWPGAISGDGGDNGPYLAVVAADAEPTNVTIRARAGQTYQAGGGVAAIPGGGEATVTLTRGQVLYLRVNGTNGDVTGTTISADKPVALFSGHQCANVPSGTGYCDHLEQQLFPVATWGDTYVVAKMRPRGREDDFYRLLALSDGTTLRTDPIVPGVDGRTLGAGEVLAFATDGDFQLTATGPVSLAQFMSGSAYGCRPTLFDQRRDCRIPQASGCGSSAIGDPAFILNVPTSQYLSEYVFYVPQQYRENAISVITDRSATIQLDGQQITQAPTQVPGTTWGIWRLNTTAGVRRLTSSSPAGLYVYGYDCDVSYAYPGGLNLQGN